MSSHIRAALITSEHACFLRKCAYARGQYQWSSRACRWRGRGVWGVRVAFSDGHALIAALLRAANYYHVVLITSRCSIQYGVWEGGRRSSSIPGIYLSHWPFFDTSSINRYWQNIGKARPGPLPTPTPWSVQFVALGMNFPIWDEMVKFRPDLFFFLLNVTY